MRLIEMEAWSPFDPVELSHDQAAEIAGLGLARLTEYQFAGDCEAHGIPAKP